MWTRTHFQAYIVGQDVTVYTDHAALTSLLKAPKLSGRLMRWSLKLQQYKPTIKHRPGAMNSVADALSRIPQTQALQVVMACLTSSTESEDQSNSDTSSPSLDSSKQMEGLGNLQREDTELKVIIDYLLTGKHPEDATLARKLALETPGSPLLTAYFSTRILGSQDASRLLFQEWSENNSSKRAMMEGSVDASRRSVLGKLSRDGTGSQPCVVTSVNAVMLVSTVQRRVVTAIRKEHQ